VFEKITPNWLTEVPNASPMYGIAEEDKLLPLSLATENLIASVPTVK